MQIEITLAKSTPLPAGALEALSKELHLRIGKPVIPHLIFLFSGLDSILRF